MQGQTIKPGHHIRHDLRVAYELLLDAKRHKLRIADMVQAQQDHSRTPPANGSSPIRISLGNSTPPSGSKVDMTRGSGLGGTMGGAGMHPQHLSGGIGGTQPPTRRRRWYLGIQSKKDPSHVMTEVYKAMFALDCLWHQMTNYRVLCLWKRGAMAGAIGGPDGQMQPHNDAVMGELVGFILLLLPSPALKPLLYIGNRRCLSKGISWIRLWEGRMVTMPMHQMATSRLPYLSTKFSKTSSFSTFNASRLDGRHFSAS